MNALATLEQLPLTKQEQEQFTNLLIDEILSGNANPIKVDVILKALSSSVEKARKDKRVKEQLKDQLKEGYVEAYGARIQLTKRTEYNYSECGDTVYNDMIAQQEALNEQIKAREQMLKTGVNPESGEVYTKPKTSTTEHVKITFK